MGRECRIGRDACRRDRGNQQNHSEPRPPPPPNPLDHPFKRLGQIVFRAFSGSEIVSGAFGANRFRPTIFFAAFSASKTSPPPKGGRAGLDPPAPRSKEPRHRLPRAPGLLCARSTPNPPTLWPGSMAAAAPEGCAALGPVDLDRCLAVARQAAEAAGAEIRAGLGAHRRVVHQKYNAHDLVTATDLRCEEVIRAHVRAAFGAAHRFIGEESAEEGPGAGQLTAHPTWIVDPLDGTANFVHGLPQVTVSIGLAVGGAPVLGVVYHPPSGEMFTAVKSRGVAGPGEGLP